MERVAWLARAEPLMKQTELERLKGLETWFSLPGRTAPAPPKWKTAVLAIVAIYPIALMVNMLVMPQSAAGAALRSRPRVAAFRLVSLFLSLDDRHRRIDLRQVAGLCRHGTWGTAADALQQSW